MMNEVLLFVVVYYPILFNICIIRLFIILALLAIVLYLLYVRGNEDEKE